MPPPPKLTFFPPLLNSASPWATTRENLRDLLLSPHTGAVTTRTSLLQGYNHQDGLHRYLFFDPSATIAAPGTASGPEPPEGVKVATATASLNCLGYSPIPLGEYLEIIRSLTEELPEVNKTVLISVTGIPEDMAPCYTAIFEAQSTIRVPLAMEINLSCPNIPGASPPAYNGNSIAKYLDFLPSTPQLPIGVKTPPYTHGGQYEALIFALRTAADKISFVTSTNTLGSCLILDQDAPSLPGPGGLGGMAGPPLHPLALGNVLTIRVMLDARQKLAHIDVVGVGGVADGEGYRRMRAAGATAVGVGTGLGRQGVAVFEKIEKDLDSAW